MKTTKLFVLAFATVVAAGVPLTSAANAATGKASRPPKVSAGQKVNAPREYWRYDFTVSGVRIWSDDNPHSTILGLGYPGQGFNVDLVYGSDYSYTCDNGVTTWTWLHGYDIATGVTGFVPTCNTNY